jgi:hypothetical protein
MAEENLESEPQGEEYPSYQVSFSEKGEIEGLPENVKPKDVIVFMGPDGNWYAQNASQELLNEVRQWRSDWNEEV